MRLRALLGRKAPARGKMPGAGSRGCAECAGRGRCRTCRGEGKLVVKGGKDKIKCYECEGSKRCWFCLGKGRVTDDLFEAREAYETRVKRMSGLTSLGHRPTALARHLLDARRSLRQWDIQGMENALREFDAESSARRTGEEDGTG